MVKKSRRFIALSRFWAQPYRRRWPEQDTTRQSKGGNGYCRRRLGIIGM
jgi:hypothetical protein